jgi:acyl carrier protein
MIAEVLDRPVQEIPDDASATTLEGWDSLRHLELMLALEAEFEIRIPTAAMRDLGSVEQIDEYLRAHEEELGT